MGPLLGVELRHVSMEVQKEPQEVELDRAGRAGLRLWTVDGGRWRSRDKLLLGLADKVSWDG